MMRRTSWLVFFPALALVACTGNSGGGTAARGPLASGIVGGEKVAETSWIAKRSVLLMIRTGEDSRKTTKCSGTLVARDIVLSAAHCVSGKTPGQVRVFFTTDFDRDSERGDWRGKMAAVTDIRQPQKEDDGGETPDLALLKLDRPAPSGFEVSTLVQFPLEWSRFRHYLLAGYGRGEGMAAQNDLRAVQVPALRGEELEKVKERLVKLRLPRSRYSEAQLRMIYAVQLNEFLNPAYLWMNQSEGRGACIGDSGGPAFLEINGRPYQVGVAAFTMDDPERRDCLLVSAYTNVLFHRQWLQKNFSELAGPAQTRLFPDF
ncbi:MAG: trypsin-like serine protease [Bdellovibrionaceae bacterium]|nr:trypsin-like serine protease [Pseudobdellovibrionaceae bacterium]